MRPILLLAGIGVAGVVATGLAAEPQTPAPEFQSLSSCRLAPHSLSDLALAAVSADKNAAQAAISELRAAGPVGLDALATLRDEVAAVSGETSPELRRVREAMDAVAAQRYGWASRLYWYTNLEQATAAAQALGKPILSLRLLGNLTDEYSCANSRFFRTTLYANREVSDYLREHFVLHWQSVRPVPQVTVDFGDGRKMKMTLTGNSIHYILDAEGNPLDALPGLYGPAAFLRGLQQAESLAHERARTPEDRNGILARYHRQRFSDISAAWIADLEALDIPTDQTVAAVNDPPAPAAQGNNAAPRAVDASAVARPKMALELRPLALVYVNAGRRLEELTSDDVWPRMAELHLDEIEFDAASLALMQSQQPDTSSSEGAPDERFAEVVENFRRLVAQDTVRNEYMLRRQIHGWFAAGEIAGVDALNERVYAELFLTPRSDPWLGLLPEGMYTALEDDGLVQ